MTGTDFGGKRQTDFTRAGRKQAMRQSNRNGILQEHK